MLVGGRRSVSRIFTLVHLVETLLPSEGSYPLYRTRWRRALLVWAARAGTGDLTLAVLKLQLLFISSPPPLPPSPLSSSVISAPLFHLPSSPRLSSAARFGASPPLSTPFSSRPSFTCSPSLIFFFPFISSSHIYASFPTECLFFFLLLGSSLFSLPTPSPALLRVQRSRARYVRSSQQNFASALQLCSLTCYIPARTRGRKRMHHTLHHTHTHTVGPLSRAKLNRALNFHHR